MSQARGSRLQLLACAALAGMLQAGSVADPWAGRSRWWLQIVALAGLAFLLQRVDRWRPALLVSWTFATCWLAGTFWWLFISMHTYGGLNPILAVLAVLALAAFLSLYYAGALTLWRVAAPAAPLFSTLAFAGLWLVAELMRGRWFTGFPWGAIGYAHADGPLRGLAPWVGVYGIGFVAAWICACLASLAGGWRKPRLWLGLLLPLGLALGTAPAAGVHGFGVQPHLSVTLLQGNIPQDEKFEGQTGVPLALDWYAQQLQAARGSLVVAPETAIPLLPHQLPPDYLSGLARHFRDGTQAALLGVPLGGPEQGYTNSVLGLGATESPYRYDKHHLVPFGEFIPPLFRWFTDLMNIPLGDFSRGAVGQPSFHWQGQRLAPNICYEDLFGEELAARFAEPRLAPTVFVNLSNIGWFGDTVAIDQHLQISRMRALEFARPVIRATNTGATAIIDHEGRVTHLLPRYTRGVLVGRVQGREGTTPYAWWASRWGLWPLWGLGVATVLGAAWLSRRRARP